MSNVFAHRAFRRLWFGQAISLIGDYAFTTTVALWLGLVLLENRPYAPAVTAAALVVTATVTIVAAPFAGVLVDRWHKVRVALTADVVRAVVGGGFILLPLLAETLHVGPTLVLCGIGITVEAVASVFFAPARLIIVSDVVPADRRGQAASYAQAASAIATIAGPILGSVLFVAMGPAACFALNAITFLVSFIMIWSAGAVADDGRKPPLAPGFSRELLGGLRLVARQPALRAVIGAGAIVVLGASTVNSLSVYFVRENLHADPHWFGVVSSALGAGMLAGALGAGALGDRLGYHRILIVGLFIGGLAGLGYARSSDAAVASFAIACYGLAGGAVETSIAPIVLNTVSRDYPGRVWSLFVPAFRLSSIAALVASGWLVSLMPIGQRFTIVGVRFGRIDVMLAAAPVFFLLSAAFAAVSPRAPASRGVHTFADSISQ